MAVTCRSFGHCLSVPSSKGRQSKKKESLSTQLKNKNQLDATYYFIVFLIGSTCFGHYYAHHQELTAKMLITTLVVSFCKDGRGSVNVKLCFLVVCGPYGGRERSVQGAGGETRGEETAGETQA